jgi:hypothetical protein
MRPPRRGLFTDPTTPLRLAAAATWEPDMSNAFVVETPHRTAGIAVRERSGFRFYAADRFFFGLDQRIFARFGELRRAVDAAERLAA